jgi:hypothetical protein
LGGEIVAKGKTKDLLKGKFDKEFLEKSLTLQYLSG